MKSEQHLVQQSSHRTARGWRGFSRCGSRRGAWIPQMALVVPLAVLSLGASAEVLDQSFVTGAPSLQAGIDDSSDQAQTFTVGVTGMLTRVEVDVGNVGPETGDLIVDVRETVGGVPIENDAAALASVTVPSASITTGLLSVDFSSFAVPIWNGDVLAITLRSTHIPPPCCSDYNWGGEIGNPYSGGAAYSRTTISGTWILNGTGDVGFQTFVKPGTPAERLYWTDRVDSTILRSSIDGSSIELLINSGISEPNFIAVDDVNDKMYWTDEIDDDISRADVDGSNVEVLISTGLSAPLGIALDLAGGKMYWADAGTNKIQRANLDGSSVQDLVTSGLNNPAGVALDVSAGKVYWTDFGAGKIQRANLIGTSVEDLVTGLSSPNSIALDLDDGKMYWTDSFFAGPSIRRADLDGTNAEVLISTGLSSPGGINLDLLDMYWTELGSGKIRRANLDGSNIEDVVTGESGPTGLALSTVPEPDSMAMTVAGAVTLFVLNARRRRQRAGIRL